MRRLQVTAFIGASKIRSSNLRNESYPGRLWVARSVGRFGDACWQITSTMSGTLLVNLSRVVATN